MSLLQDSPIAAQSHTPVPKRRVLVVTYTFPPVGGAGVQRITKFVKYLNHFGWEPTVLTVANPSVPLYDQSLLADVPANTEIIQARSWEPNYKLKSIGKGDSSTTVPLKYSIKRVLLATARTAAGIVMQPDPQILWYPGAVAAGKKALRTSRFDAILATAPPFSTLLVGRALARASGLPLVVDYRDEWTISNKYWENKQLGFLSSGLQTRMENSVLRAASAVVATTRASAESLAARCASARAQAQVEWIYNGFDADDFTELAPLERDRSLFRIVYTGTLWNLTSAVPLLESLRRLAAQSPELVKRVEVVFVGRCTASQRQYVDALRTLPCKVVVHDYLNHAEALRYLGSADAQCLLLSDVPGSDRVVPAKLFEYVASQQPILALLPRGEAWQLLEDVPHASRFVPSDIAGITGWLATTLERGTQESSLPNALIPAGFDRKSQASQLANVLSAVVDGAGRHISKTAFLSPIV